MLLETDESQLVLVDYQERLMPVMLEAPLVLANAGRLAQAARLLKVPVIVTEQNAPKLGATVVELREALGDYARVFPKLMFSAVEEGLTEWLQPPAKPVHGNARSLPKHLQKPVQQAPQRGTVVLAGCEAHVCLLQTALDLLEEEMDVWVVVDACASRSERNRDAAFDRLAGAGVELVTTEMVLFEWLRGAEHPHFKAVQSLIK
ncbi:isochorismatase family protein [Curvibacter sp. APW13]|uniref:isochorismatase family protein n=1 Tax=Curvibacter sp. APW13 TaxID=3077236 RepID=UPI0028DEBC7C|nr:isochorismatase family protein [Curvibacter sp. APW13]MDT8991738.1 isochorismatase family protein [Curvibacter sp. APW13]